MKDDKIKDAIYKIINGDIGILLKKDITNKVEKIMELFESYHKKECGLPTYEEITDVAEFSADTFREVEAFENGAKWMRDKASSEIEALKADKQELLIALDGILNKNEGSGCPMCDNGKLRNPEKEHWDDCVWNNARNTYERLLPPTKNK